MRARAKPSRRASSAARPGGFVTRAGSRAALGAPLRRGPHVVAALRALADSTAGQQHLNPPPRARVRLVEPDDAEEPGRRSDRRDGIVKDANTVLAPRHAQPVPAIF